MFKTGVWAIGLAAALAGAAPAQAAMPVGAVAAAPQVERVQYDPETLVVGGQEFCWYDDGWNGPGWYICGDPYEEGYGWGGGEGWNGSFTPSYGRVLAPRRHREFRREESDGFSQDRRGLHWSNGDSNGRGVGMHPNEGGRNWNGGDFNRGQLGVVAPRFGGGDNRGAGMHQGGGVPRFGGGGGENRGGGGPRGGGGGGGDNRGGGGDNRGGGGHQGGGGLRWSNGDSNGRGVGFH